MHCMTRNDCNKNAVQLVTLFMQYGFSKYNNYSEANHLSFGSGKELHPPSPLKLSHKINAQMSIRKVVSNTGMTNLIN